MHEANNNYLQRVKGRMDIKLSSKRIMVLELNGLNLFKNFFDFF